MNFIATPVAAGSIAVPDPIVANLPWPTVLAPDAVPPPLVPFAGLLSSLLGITAAGTRPPPDPAGPEPALPGSFDLPPTAADRGIDTPDVTDRPPNPLWPFLPHEPTVDIPATNSHVVVGLAMPVASAVTTSVSPTENLAPEVKAPADPARPVEPTPKTESPLPIRVITEPAEYAVPNTPPATPVLTAVPPSDASPTPEALVRDEISGQPKVAGSVEGAWPDVSNPNREPGRAERPAAGEPAPRPDDLLVAVPVKPAVVTPPAGVVAPPTPTALPVPKLVPVPTPSVPSTASPARTEALAPVPSSHPPSSEVVAARTPNPSPIPLDVRGIPTDSRVVPPAVPTSVAAGLPNEVRIVVASGPVMVPRPTPERTAPEASPDRPVPAVVKWVAAGFSPAREPVPLPTTTQPVPVPLMVPTARAFVTAGRSDLPTPADESDPGANLGVLAYRAHSPLARAESSSPTAGSEPARTSTVPWADVADHLAGRWKADRGAEVRMRIEQPNLGAVRVILRAEPGALTAVMVVATPAAREAALPRMAELAERLRAAGMGVRSVSVVLRGGESATAIRPRPAASHQGSIDVTV